MNDVLNALGLTVLAYLLASIPFGVIVGRIATGGDIRAHGSGHAGATNVMRQAGWRVAVVAALLDVSKAFVGVWLARRFGSTSWVPVLAATAAVAGHCWPLFGGFRGGMGLSGVAGALLALYPFGLIIGLGLARAGTLILRHSARGNIAAGLLLGPLLWWVSGSSFIGLAATGAGLVVAIRSLSDWGRVYKELWLDRDAAPVKR
jgi:glycerol-3-phosphate acyltransferase PlsY